ncbi:MAG: hypothetical protein QOE61_3374 [Micromonosporaceae bacterium]|jgi:hypothetical protein|nr:hypothetical protein [Micromonosporaceae bacterium]
MLIAGAFIAGAGLAGTVAFSGADRASADDTPTVAIVGYAGKCIDVPGGVSADGAGLQLYVCNRTLAQLWGFGHDGTIQALGKCMDVAWGATGNGTKIQLANCNFGPAQQFRFTPRGDLVNPQANKCVDIPDWSTADGTPLQLWDCTGSANQKWVTPGMAVGERNEGRILG